MSTYSASGADWARVRRRVLERDNWLCVYCRQAQATTVDHVTPRARGGTDTEDNLVASCRPCNGRKGVRVLERANYVNARWLGGDVA